ncbi:MAG TPA: hypothetical protein VJA19_04340 [Pseudomonas sp.]|nr:hypothetical protein [Pseudomonas sp.]
MFDFTEFTDANLEACAEAFAGLAPSSSQRAALVRDRLCETRNPVGARWLALLGFGPAPRQAGH